MKIIPAINNTAEIKLVDKNSKAYQAWLSYNQLDEKYFNNFKQLLNNVSLLGGSAVSSSIREELNRAITKFTDSDFALNVRPDTKNGLIFAAQSDLEEIAAANEQLQKSIKKIKKLYKWEIEQFKFDFNNNNKNKFNFKIKNIL